MPERLDTVNSASSSTTNQLLSNQSTITQADLEAVVLDPEATHLLHILEKMKDMVVLALQTITGILGCLTTTVTITLCADTVLHLPAACTVITGHLHTIILLVDLLIEDIILITDLDILRHLITKEVNYYKILFN